MNIRELIKELEDYAKKYGEDTEVVIPYRDSRGCYYEDAPEPIYDYSGKKILL